MDDPADEVLLEAAKRLDVTIALIGHVTKEGSLAGPRALEHLVDCVLHFEGERERSFRTLRALKNRFGSTNEVGVFEMTDRGMIEVEDPSAFFLSKREEEVPPGVVTVCLLEGTRPMLVEVQATAEQVPFSRPELDTLLELAADGIEQIGVRQYEALEAIHA